MLVVLEVVVLEVGVLEVGVLAVAELVARMECLMRMVVNRLRVIWDQSFSSSRVARRRGRSDSVRLLVSDLRCDLTPSTI